MLLNAKQPSLLTMMTGFEIASKRTRKRIFLEEMDQVVPWDTLVELIAPHNPKSSTGRPPFGIEVLLRIHFLQQWFGLSDPAMEEALHDTPLYREFALLDAGNTRLPDESTILRFRHLLEAHQLAPQILTTVNTLLAKQGLLLKSGTAVDATLIAAPSSTKNSAGKRDPDMHQTKKGGSWYFGMKAHVGVDADSGLVHTIATTPANAHDITKTINLLHGQETDVFGDSGYRGIDKREEAQGLGVAWHIAMMPSKRKTLNRQTALGQLLEQAEQVKAKIRAKVEHPFRVIKCQFGYRKVRYVGLAKNTAQIQTLFALSNLWMARRHLMKAA